MSVVKTLWVGLHCHGKGDTNQPPLANVLDKSANFPRHEEIIVGANDDVLGECIC